MPNDRQPIFDPHAAPYAPSSSTASDTRGGLASWSLWLGFAGSLGFWVVLPVCRSLRDLFGPTRLPVHDANFVIHFLVKLVVLALSVGASYLVATRVSLGPLKRLVAGYTIGGGIAVLLWLFYFLPSRHSPHFF